MTATGALLAILCIWLAIGVVSSVVMARRGHNPWSWGALGALLGPLVVPVAVSVTQREDEGSRANIVHAGQPGSGSRSVLIGVDGSVDSETAMDTARRVLGPQLGRVVLATVVDYDTKSSERAERLLAEAAESFGTFDPDRVILTGRPADALLEYARDNDIDLIVVGTRGRGLAPTVLGSVAEGIVSQHDIPVLVAGAPSVVQV